MGRGVEFFLEQPGQRRGGQIIFSHLMGESVWPEEDRTGQGRVEGINFSDHHGTTDAQEAEFPLIYS